MNLYLFRLFPAIWVEISERQYWESLPFFRDFRLLGRYFQRQYWESLPFSQIFRLLGRDSRMAVAGFSTYFLVFRRLGRDFRTAVLGIFTFSADFWSAKSVVASFCSHVITCTSICTKIV